MIQSTHFNISKQLQPKAPWDMDISEKLETCNKRKLEGNQLFKLEKFRRAHAKYKKAIEYVSLDYEMDNEHKAKAKELRLVCYTNMAACDLKLKQYNGAIDDCEKVISTLHTLLCWY